MRDKKQQPKGGVFDSNNMEVTVAEEEKHSKGSKELDDYTTQEDWIIRKIMRYPKMADLSDEQWEVL